LVLPTIAALHRGDIPQIGAIAGYNLSDFIAILLLPGYLASILFSVFHIGYQSKVDEEEIEPITWRSFGGRYYALAYLSSPASAE
jgi:Ca2+:H+ antiporter